MTKNPILNALAASLYIILIASFMFFAMNHTGPDNSVVVPVVVLSLFTFSAAAMGYIFLAQPLQLYLDGKKKEAVKLFIQTLAIFGGITALAIILLLSGFLK